MKENEAIKTWIKRNENKFKDISERDHLLDYLNSCYKFKKSINFSYEQCVIKAKEWVSSLSKDNKSEGRTELIREFVSGNKIVKLIDSDSRKWESYYMNHCVASDSYINKTIYSLRDKNNIPHCTIEANAKEIVQIKGPANKGVNPKYIEDVVCFLEEFNKISNDQIENIGYIPIKKSLEKIINMFFTGQKYITINKSRYIYVHKQIKPISDKLIENNYDLFLFLCKTGTSDDYLHRLLSKNIYDISFNNFDPIIHISKRLDKDIFFDIIENFPNELKLTFVKNCKEEVLFNIYENIRLITKKNILKIDKLASFFQLNNEESLELFNLTNNYEKISELLKNDPEKTEDVILNGDSIKNIYVHLLKNNTDTSLDCFNKTIPIIYPCLLDYIKFERDSYSFNDFLEKFINLPLIKNNEIEFINFVFFKNKKTYEQLLNSLQDLVLFKDNFPSKNLNSKDLSNFILSKNINISINPDDTGKIIQLVNNLPGKESINVYQKLIQIDPLWEKYFKESLGDSFYIDFLTKA